MDQSDIQQKVEAFLKELGVPGFIVFGFMKEETQFEIISSYNQMPTNAAVKGLAKVLHEFTDRAL